MTSARRSLMYYASAVCLLARRARLTSLARCRPMLCSSWSTVYSSLFNHLRSMLGTLLIVHRPVRICSTIRFVRRLEVDSRNGAQKQRLSAAFMSLWTVVQCSRRHHKPAIDAIATQPTMPVRFRDTSILCCSYHVYDKTQCRGAVLLKLGRWR